ncbi:MAG TPA: alpha/beta hydrolase [Kofleriaceae bacterium]|jgi:pimeloyl-ACP methyl ester carboxylesterase|nr:alpha/beta hydrolase [Kofleriaceae bacterium]
MDVQVNGTRLVVERAGQGPTILFIHGATLDRRMWRTQLEGLSDRFDVITYDLRGFGQSAVPVPPFKHCEDAAALLDQLGVKRATVVGHSIGGLYALELCFLRPDLVSGLVEVCMSGLGEPSFPDAIVAKFGACRQAARERTIDEAKAVWKTTGWFDSAMKVPALANELEAMLADYSGIYWAADVSGSNIEPPVRTRLEELRIPTLVIDGGLDLDYNHQIADILARRITGARLLRLPHVGHMANMEDPAAVNEAIAALLLR